MINGECNCPTGLDVPRHLHMSTCPAYLALETWQATLLAAARKARDSGGAVLLHAPPDQGATENQMLAAVVAALHEGKDVVIVRTPRLRRDK